jgi:FG-GAP repeat protein
VSTIRATCIAILFLAAAQTGTARADSFWIEWAAHPSDDDGDNFYGTAAALTPTLAVIGAFGDDSHRGAAYVLKKSGSMWLETQKLLADDGVAGDELGYDAAATGDLIAVTAWNAMVDGNVGQGATYLFEIQNGQWTQVQKLLADDGTFFDNFGQSVALDGSTVLVGANGATIGDQGAQGTAYVFVNSGSGWVQQQKLIADDGDTVDNFGSSAAISGDTILVGALQAAVEGHANQGAVYYFAGSGGTWTQTQKISAGDGGAGDLFGASMSFDGTTLVVGATGADGRGAAYVFTNTGGAWTEVQKLTADDGASGDNFGDAVSLSGDNILVAADVATVDGITSRGAAYLFTRVGDTWAQTHKFVASDGATDNFYGASAALDGNTAVLTSAQRNTAYFYTRDSLFVDGFDG